MEFDPENPLLQGHHTSNRALIQKYFDLELEFMVARGYSKKQKFIAIRSIAISKIGEFTCDGVDPLVPFLAITYFDRFLSKNLNIPVVLRGRGLEENLTLFVFCCVSIACKLRCSDFSFVALWNKHQVAKVRSVLIMELQILEGLRWKVRPVTAITLMHFFLPLLRTEDGKQFLSTTTLSHIIVAIQKDIRFTEFRPSTLAASVILVTTYKLLPGLYSEFSRKILRPIFVNQAEVERCFDELKDHVIPDSILNPGNCPLIFKEMAKWGLRQEKAKEELLEESPIGYAAEAVDTSEITTEITNVEEGRIKRTVDFDLDWFDPEYGPGPGPVRDLRYGPMERFLSWFWPMVMKCFGLHFGSPRSN